MWITNGSRTDHEVHLAFGFSRSRGAGAGEGFAGRRSPAVVTTPRSCAPLTSHPPLPWATQIVATGPAFVLECAFDLYFYIDVVLNFFTGYYDNEEGCLVLNHRCVQGTEISETLPTIMDPPSNLPWSGF